jgi:predicted transcriptional regulator
MREIVLRSLSKPKGNEINNKIEWLCNSLGFGSSNKIALEIFKEFLEEFSNNGPVPTEKIANRLNIASQRVNYHIRDLVDSGLLYREKKKIAVRQGSVKKAIYELRRDIDRFFDEIEKVAEEIDVELRLR